MAGPLYVQPSRRISNASYARRHISGFSASSISASVAGRTLKSAMNVTIVPHAEQIVLSPASGALSRCTPDANRNGLLHCGHFASTGNFQATDRASGTSASIQMMRNHGPANRQFPDRWRISMLCAAGATIVAVGNAESRRKERTQRCCQKQNAKNAGRSNSL